MMLLLLHIRWIYLYFGELNVLLLLRVLLFPPRPSVYFQSPCMFFDNDFQKFYSGQQVEECTNLLRPCD